MTEPEVSREEDLRRLLTDAIEVQLAALRAGISFWSEWVEHTSKFVQSATESLSNMKADTQQAKDVLLELVDAGRASVRSLTEIPRHTAVRFLEELDKIEQEKEAAEEPESAGGSAPQSFAAAAAAGSTAKRARPPAPAKKAARRPPPKRAGRVKP